MAAEGPKCNEKTEAECIGSKTCTWLSLIDKEGNKTGKGACVSNEVANGPAEGRKSGNLWGYYNEYTEEAQKEINAWEPGETTSLTVAQIIGLLKKPRKATPTREQKDREKELEKVIKERRERLQGELEEAKDDKAIREIVERELSAGEGEGEGEISGIASGLASGLSNLFNAVGGAVGGAGSALASRTVGIGSVLASGTSTLINSIVKLNTHEMLEAIIIITRLNTNSGIKKILYSDLDVIDKLDSLLSVSEDENVKKDIISLKEIFQNNLKNMTGGNNYKYLYLKYKAKYLKLKKVRNMM
jgi:hypothetical protein